MYEQTVRRAVLPLGIAATAALVAAGVAAAAPVRGSIAGPVTAVKGKTFTVKTSLSPTGSSKVTVGSKTQITTQALGKRADLKKGVCVTASGTKKGAVVTAVRLSIVPAVAGKCATPFGGGRGNRVRPPGAGPGSGGQNGGGQGGGQNGGQGFRRPANFGFAFGTVTAVKGATVTVKGQQGTKKVTTKVTVSAKTQITKTVHVAVKAIKLKECAFVDGTSTDKGVTVTAQSVRLSQPRNGSCTFGGRRGP